MIRKNWNKNASKLFVEGNFARNRKKWAEVMFCEVNGWQIRFYLIISLLSFD